MTPFVDRLATEEEKKAGVAWPVVLSRTPVELQQKHRGGVGWPTASTKTG